MFEKEKAVPGRYPGTADIAKTTDGRNYPRHAGDAQPRRLPPYSKNLRPRSDRSLIVITGSRGWELFQRQGQGIDYALLIPDGDPSLYRLPDLSGWADSLLIDCDGTLTHGAERELARALLAAGAPYVVGCWSSYARRADA